MDESGLSYSANDYVRALGAIKGRLTRRHREILSALYAAPDHSASSGDLAIAMGYQTRQPLNKSRQHIAEMLCEELGLRTPDPVLVLATSYQRPGMEPLLTLRPAFVAALEGLGWTVV